MSKTNKIVITVLLTLSVMLLALNITLALLNDRKVESGIIQFKQHKLNIDIVGNNSIILTPEELSLGSKTTRTINIFNPTTSTSCVFRIWLEFYVENEIDTEYLSFSLNENNFTLSDSGKFYYNSVLNSGSKLNNLVLNFQVSNNVSSDYQGKSYNLKLYIESIQSSKGAVESEWQNQFPVEWFNNISTSLTD